MKTSINYINLILFFLITLLSSCDNSSFSKTTKSQSLARKSNKNISINLDQTCTNEKVGYQVNYPQNWQTNSGDVMNDCQVFDPNSAKVPEQTESISKAIYLRVEENTPFDLVSQENLGEQHLSKETLTIDSYQAVAVESESTGRAMLPKGQRNYSYIVDLGNRTFIATTYDVPNNNYTKNKQILDDMLKTIEFSEN
ncbi:hypothetical protein [Crocosphaera chwakensis]|uniref:PsbP C-terminal domain-containing protein n=1 Tax=Crocosphaera chwakensis CCY0110 TaxID=391612 RepID=A3IYR8_9CHRO|nr:hypothetical protein [Crocosphaera chwakensis]EAZ88390.1 hypothetical protein CY0110_09570 [Crocosphaera chwakensis CCY0110]